MKKIVRKFWGVAITVMLLSSLFIVGAPAAAVPLQWNQENGTPSFIPNAVWTQYGGSNIRDFAVSADGMTIYAALDGLTFPAGLPPAPSNAVVLKSTNGGASWTDLTSPANNRLPATIVNVDFVAISPDNPDIVVVLDATTLIAAASADGGLTFGQMPAITATGGVSAIAAAYDLDVGPATSGNIYYVAIAGTSDITPPDSNLPAIYFFPFGSGLGGWREAVTDFGNAAFPPTGATFATANPTLVEIDNFRAVKFAADGTLIALSEQIGDGVVDGVLRLHAVSLTAHRWDANWLPASQYPLTVDTVLVADGPSGVNVASLAVGPSFAVGEEEGNFFIGASITDGTPAEVGGIYRVNESGDLREIRSGIGINSIDYDDVTVVAGAYMDNNVYRVTDPLAGSPSAAAARSMKRIGINDLGGGPGDAFNDRVIVHFAGETIFGSKRGDASALSKSIDLGLVWNDYTLMDSANTVIDDILFAPDGSSWYMAASDWAAGEGEASVYYMAAGQTKRVLCVSMTAAGAPNFKLRGTPGDPNVIYAFDQNDATVPTPITDIYQSSDAGVNRWSRRTVYPGAVINELVVESSTIIYGATGQLVYRSTNSGASWASGVNTNLSGGVFNMISLGEGRLVGGSNSGGVAFSTDSAATWTPLSPLIGTTGAVPLYVAASGLTASDWIFAAPVGGAVGTGANAQVYRAPAAFFGAFQSMNLWDGATGTAGYTSPATVGTLYPAASTAQTRGLKLVNGILYVLGAENGAPVGAAPGLVPTMTGIYLSHSLAPTIPGNHGAALWGTQFKSPMGYSTVPDLELVVSSIKVYSIFNWINFLGQYPPTVMYFDDIVSQPTAAPTLIGPADGALFKILSTMNADSQLVNFTWNRAAPQITSYNLFVALDENFTESAPGFPIFGVASVAPSDVVSSVAARGSFDPGRTYYWRVSTRTPFNGGFSETRSFTIEPSVATVPQILAPINGATVNTLSPAFSWGAVTDATMYEFQLSDLPGFETTIFTDETSGPGEALPVTIELERGKTYFWRVRAIEPTMGDWSPTANFMIAELTTTPTQPTPTQTTITIPPPPPGTTTIITVPPPEEPDQIAPAYIWAIIVIGAILVIAVIVLIVRTRRSV